LGERCVDQYCDGGNGVLYSAKVFSSAGEGMAEPGMNPKLGFAYLSAVAGQIAAVAMIPGGALALRALGMKEAVEYANACAGGDSQACGRGFLALTAASFPNGPTAVGLASGTTRGTGTLGQIIASGHAFAKHVIKKQEFKSFGITTPDQFAKHIDHVVRNAKGANVRHLSNGRSAYWDDASGTVVIRDPKSADGGTAMRPTAGKKYFHGLK
jgi:hypothetical protein